MKSSSNSVTAVILGAGKGERAGLGYNKVLFSLGGQPLIKATADKFSRCDKIVVVCPESEKDTFENIFQGDSKVTVITGGNSRTESVRRALPYCSTDITLIHDGARPYVSTALIDEVIEVAAKNGSAIPCTTADVAIKLLDGEKLVSKNRDEVYFVQTPQGFRTELIVDAYDKVSGNYADDSEVFEKAGYDVFAVNGEKDNVKLTNKRDFVSCYKIGAGYDVHRLTENRKLILGGVQIPFDKGLLGHSDADVLTHAVMDAILSALGLPDIGVLFPDDDPATENISSILLLARVMEKLDGAKIINLSAVVMAEKPKLASFIPAIRQSLSTALNVPYDCVDVSATTTEGLGIVGEGKGIASSATVLISK